MDETVTTLLDAVGLLAVATGVGLGAFRWLGWWSIAVGGAIVLGGSAFAAWRQNAAPRTPDGSAP